MKNYLLLAGLLLALGSQAQDTNPPTLKQPRQTKYDPQVFELTNNGIKFSLSYLDPAELAGQFEKDAKLNMWTEAQRAEEKAKLPAGGYLKGSWSRDTPLLASADNFVFLAQTADGQEIRRWKPQPSLARPFSMMGATVYTDLALVPLAEPLPDGARVYVIEAVAHRRFEYVIHPATSR